MSIPVNFITASAKGVRMAKEITATGTTPYPRVKRLSSETHHIPHGSDGLNQLLDLMIPRAAAGAAMLKGPLLDTIIDESRKGKTDKAAPTPLLVIDIDGWVPDAPLPESNITQGDLRGVAESIVNLLPEPLNRTSYIANASSSTGTKITGEVGLHLFFTLDRAVAPRRLEAYLKSLNFHCEAFTKRLSLQASRMTLKWVIDPVVARNAQVIYIAPPAFSGRDDPFATPEDRWALVNKEFGSCDLTPHVDAVDDAKTQTAEQKALNELRKGLGLGKFKPKMRRMNLGGDATHVVTNPDSMAMEMSYKSDRFVYWNINGGDSNAYYTPIGNPEIVYNFKGEPPFEMKKACPEAYDWCLETFKHEIRAVNEARPLAFRDEVSDTHYAVEYVPAHDRVLKMNKIARQNLDDWFAEFGMTPPSPIPTWSVEFDPKSTNELNWDEQIVNQFQATEYVRNPPAILPSYSGTTIGFAAERMAALCPIIHKVLFHICGSSVEDFEYFVNWLAWTFQNREKAHTAWVFSGVPGTGKGVFYERILRPLMGERYAIRKRLDHLEEQFNAYQETALFLIWEEFRLADSAHANKLLNKMKDDIVSDRVNVRAMRTDVVEKKSFTNYIFFSNHNDALPIENGDRRFNIAPPQTVKLEVKHPEIRTEVHQIENELGSFAGFLAAFEPNEQLVRTVRENDAKRAMQKTAMGFGKRFCNAVANGELVYLLDTIVTSTANSGVKALQASTATKHVKAWAEHATTGEVSIIPLEALLTCYELVSSSREQMTVAQFITFLKRNDIEVSRLRVNGRKQPATAVRWVIDSEEDREYVREMAGTNLQQPAKTEVQCAHAPPIHH